MAAEHDNPFGAEGGNPFGDDPAGKSNPFQEPDQDDLLIPSKGRPTAERLLKAKKQLQEKERLLEAREAALRDREAHAAKLEGDAAKALRHPNFPSFYPVVYHNLEEIPHGEGSRDFRQLVQRLFVVALMTCVGLCWNMLTITTLYMSSTPKTGKNIWSGTSCILYALLYVLFGVPGAWHGWYMRAYNGFKDDSSSALVVFMLFFSFHIAFSFVVAFGFPGYSGAGLLAMMTVFDWRGATYWPHQLLCILDTIIWMMVLGLSVNLIQQVHNEYQIKGVDGIAILRRDMSRGLGRAAADEAAAQAQESATLDSRHNDYT